MIIKIDQYHFCPRTSGDRKLIEELVAVDPGKLPDPTVAPAGTSKAARELRQLVNAVRPLVMEVARGDVATSAIGSFLAIRDRHGKGGSRKDSITQLLGALNRGDPLPPALELLQIHEPPRGKPGGIVAIVRKIKAQRPQLGPQRLDREGGPAEAREAPKSTAPITPPRDEARAAQMIHPPVKDSKPKTEDKKA